MEVPRSRAGECDIAAVSVEVPHGRAGECDIVAVSRSISGHS